MSRSAPATSSTLADILDEVDPDVCRLTFLLQGIDTTQTFDLDVVTAQSMENPVYYVQYAHARIASIGRKAADGRDRATRRSSMLISRCSCTSASSTCCARWRSYPDVVAEAAVLRAPHRVTTWVRDFAGTFHGFYRDCRVISDDAALTQARLWLAEACRIGLAHALGLLGVRAPDEMRRLDDDDRGERPRARTVRRSEPTHRRMTDAITAAAFDATLLPPAVRAIDLERVADEFGTPLFVYDEDELRAPCREYVSHFGPDRVAYAGKAFLCTAMARLVAGRGLHLDVATGGELHVALRAGFPPTRIVFHGNNKSRRRARSRARCRRRADRRRLVRRARPSRGARCTGASSRSTCWCG